jgi:hypothetical protein
MPYTGANWKASYDELAKLDEGRHMQPFDGVPLNSLLEVDMSRAVGGAPVWAGSAWWCDARTCSILFAVGVPQENLSAF